MLLEVEVAEDAQRELDAELLLALGVELLGPLVELVREPLRVAELGRSICRQLRAEVLAGSPRWMPFQSQSSGGLFGGQLSSTIAPTMRSMQIEQALALLGEALRHQLDELVVELDRRRALRDRRGRASRPSTGRPRAGASRARRAC